MAANDKAIVQLANGTFDSATWDDMYMPIHQDGQQNALRAKIKALAEFLATVSQIGIGNYRGNFQTGFSGYRTGDYVREPSTGAFWLYVASSDGSQAALSDDTVWGKLFPQGGGGGGGGGGTGFIWRGVHQVLGSYVPNDVVQFDGSTYICVAPASGSAQMPGSSPNWDLMASKGATGNPGADGPAGPTGPSGVGVSTANVNASGELTITLTDATTQGPFNVKGPMGDQGPAGLQGPMGDQGPAGPQGPNRVDANTEVNLTGFLIGNGSNIGSRAFGANNSGALLDADGTTLWNVSIQDGIVNNFETQ
jgi:hypothetical protein